MCGCRCFNRDDRLTSPLYVSSAYQPAPCCQRFHFTRPPTPPLPLDIYTNPFVEDSLGLLSLSVCVCVCVWTSVTPPPRGLQHSLSASSLVGVTMSGLFLRGPQSTTLWASGGERGTKDKSSFRPQPPWFWARTVTHWPNVIESNLQNILWSWQWSNLIVYDAN